MNPFTEVFRSLSQDGMGDEGERIEAAHLAFKEADLEIARIMAQQYRGDIKTFLESIQASLFGGGDMELSELRERAAQKLVGLCENPSADDETLEWVVLELLSQLQNTASSNQPKELLAVLRDYVRLRQPGELFWSGWEKHIARSEWRGHIDWQFLAMYLEKDGVGDAEFIDTVEKFGLYNVHYVYLQRGVGVGKCREWLLRASERLHPGLKTTYYAPAVLELVYAADPGRVAEIMDTHMLAWCMAHMYGWGGDLNNVVKYAMGHMADEVVVEALGRVNSRKWNGVLAPVVVEAFGDLSAAVQAEILKLAPYDVKARAIGRLTRGDGAEQAQGDGGRCAPRLN